MEEQLTIFGPSEGLKPIKKTKSKDEVFNDYEGFVSKFEAKRTTDDCYTPEPVYRAVLEFVGTLTVLAGRPIVRPFYPGGDYEAFEYPENCIVIDNPPFSILAKIIRFYSLHGVQFFLFGPELTLFTCADCDLTYIIPSVCIKYENGAKVPTGFITNISNDARIWCCPELKELIEKAQAEPSKARRQFIYDSHIVTAAKLKYISEHGVSLKIAKNESRFIRTSENYQRIGRDLFGGGYLISDRAAAERAAAERAAAERAAAERAAAERAAAERAAAERAAANIIELSPREKLIIEELNANIAPPSAL